MMHSSISFSRSVEMERWINFAAIVGRNDSARRRANDDLISSILRLTPIDDAERVFAGKRITTIPPTTSPLARPARPRRA